MISHNLIQSCGIGVDIRDFGQKVHFNNFYDNTINIDADINYDTTYSRIVAIIIMDQQMKIPSQSPLMTLVMDAAQV